MRFFKYLVFILLSSVTTVYAGFSAGNDTCFDTAQKACNYILDNSKDPSEHSVTASNNVCHFKNQSGQWYRQTTLAQCQLQNKCPEKGTPADFHKGANGQIPTKRCMNINGSICSFSAQGKQPFWVNLVGGNTPTRQLYSDSENPSPSCQNLDDGQCDSSNPYGDCYQRPNDGCVRNSDGSINCPQNQPPPINQGCENGAAYCDRPPQGCGLDYVSGSFNGRQICVRKGPDSPTDPNQPITPNDPTDPNNPNKCTGSYCPKPDNDKDCPTGYYKTQFQGKSICVKDNPNPNQQNPNDPNNSPNPPQPNDPNNPNPPFDSSGIINAIKSLRDSLLGSIDGVSRKLTTLIDGQKTSNEHLKNIKDESVKSNESLKKIDDSTRSASEALGTTNGHLDNIDEATKAASEGIGETNKKLDGVKDSIDGLNKCNNESYNPNDPNSSKYRQCTESDLPSDSGDSTLDIGGISVGNYESNYVSWASQCPPDNHVNINMMGQSSTLVLSWSPLCDLLSRIRWAIIASAYFAAAYIILGMR